jgi:hypothetical protein
LKTEVFAYAGKTDHPFRLILSQTEAVQALSMRAGIVVMPDDRRRLEAIVGDRNAPQKHVWRAKIARFAARVPNAGGSL